MGLITNFATYKAMFQQNPVQLVLVLLMSAVAILAALILHEIAHGYVAYRCGDPTAKMLGRLSLNPAKHLDPIGTACLVLFSFGWAKPVPVNPRNFHNYRRDDIAVSLAGITVNFGLFLVFYVAQFFLSRSLFVSINGAMYWLSARMYDQPLWYLYYFCSMFASLNLCLAIFNLLPIPPLDGFHVFNDILFKGSLGRNPRFFEISRVALLLLCFTGVFGRVLGFLVGGVESGMDWLLGLVAGQG